MKNELGIIKIYFFCKKNWLTLSAFMLTGFLLSFMWVTLSQKKYESSQDIYIGKSYSEAKSELRPNIEINRYLLRFNSNEIKDVKILSACKKNTGYDNNSDPVSNIKVALKKGQIDIIEISSIGGSPENAKLCTYELASFIYKDLFHLANIKLEVLEKNLAIVRNAKANILHLEKSDATNRQNGQEATLNHFQYMNQLEYLNNREIKLTGAISDSLENLPEMLTTVGKARILGARPFVFFIMGIFFGAVAGIVYILTNDAIKSRLKNSQV